MKIAICCSSSDKLDKQYIQSSQRLCEAIFRQEHDLVFGAMNHGIMGIAYRIAKSHGRNVIGIAPELYKDDFKELDCETELLTKNVSDRMQVLIDNSDVLLFLPGGVGTLYELMAALEMKRSKEFNKPLIIYNETGFFNEILQMLDKVYQKGFTGSEVRANYKIANDYISVLDLLNRSQSRNNEKDELSRED